MKCMAEDLLVILVPRTLVLVVIEVAALVFVAAVAVYEDVPTEGVLVLCDAAQERSR